MAISFGETFTKIRECFQEPEISWTVNLKSVTIIRDIYGKIRLYLEQNDSFKPKEAEISALEHSLSQKLGHYYGDDIWLQQDNQDGYKSLVEVILSKRVRAEWDDATVLPRWYILERHIAKKAWTDTDLGSPPWDQEHVDKQNKPAIVTFFSFKGGVGRTTGLVACAITLARQGHRVAIVDLDLEAPGLRTIFFPDDDENPGVIDYLYQLLFKRLANSGSEMTEYLRIVPDLINDSHTALGIMTVQEESLFQSIIEKIIGKFMGANARKGYTYSWIPNHLQDAGGRIAPRSFLNLFSLAANRRLQKFNEQNEQSLSGTTLLQPSDLQGALMDTSEDRIKELAQEEYPWLEALKTSLMDLEVPTPESKFLEVLTTTGWSEQLGKRPPTSKPEEVLKYLLQLGIVESRSDGRINMPEIYLYGFKVKRRGGIKRPK